MEKSPYICSIINVPLTFNSEFVLCIKSVDGVFYLGVLPKMSFMYAQGDKHLIVDMGSASDIVYEGHSFSYNQYFLNL